jgi:peptide/nickel transport system ATP-binding protein
VSEKILSVRDLQVSFETRRGLVRAVNGMNFDLNRGETLGIVGESGSGKSVSMNAVMGLLRDKNVKISGEVIFNGSNLLSKSDERDAIDTWQRNSNGISRSNDCINSGIYSWLAYS